MGKKEIIISLLFFILVSLLFFYKTIFSGLIPFPGDLLLSSYKPWQAYSYLGYNPGAYPSKFQYFDTIRQIYPWKSLSIDQIKKGEIPLWNPYNFSGSPLMANFQSSIFYALNLLYLILPQITAWTILVIAQTILAGFFTYLFARKIGMDKMQAIFSGVAFSYSLFIAVFLEYNTIVHTILWLPATLYFFEKILTRRTIYNTAAFTLSILFSFFAGHIQIFTFTLLFIIAYILYRTRVKFWIFTLILLTLGICAIQLFPTLELINLSARIPHEHKFLIENLLLKPAQLILFLSPDFFGNPATGNYLLTDSYPGNAVYIGLAPFIFSIFAIRFCWKKTFVKFFALGAVILLILFLRSPITENFYSIQLPFFSTGSPTNAIFLLSFCLSILSGFGMGVWLKKENKNFYTIITAFLLIFILIWLVILTSHPVMSERNFTYSTLIFTIFVAIFLLRNIFSKKKVLTTIIILITVFDLFYFFQKFNPFVPRDLIFPKADIFSVLERENGINRFWGYGTGAIDANFATQYKLFSTDGYDPLYPSRYGGFIQSTSDGKIKEKFTSQTRSDAFIVPGFGEEDLSSNLYRLKILDILGVKYILDRTENGSTEKTFPVDRFKLLHEENGWRIFENLKASPRMFLASDYKIFKSNDEFEKMFFSKDFNPSQTLLLEEDIGTISKNQEAGELNIVSYTPNKITLTVKTDSQKLLFLSDTYYPGWKAFVDGKETKIYRADFSFRAILLPEGSHNVLFKYKPKSFELGLKTTIISIITTIVFLYLLDKRKIYET